MPLLVSSSHPRIILGTMTFGPDAKDGARVTDLDEYRAALDALQQAGHNEIDTARIYQAGNQEAFTAAAGYKDRGLTIATKAYPINGMTHKPAVLRKTFETSLASLQTDCVDIFYLHAADRSTPFEETLEEVDKFFQEGKFVKFGLSNFTAFEVAEVVLICRQHGWVRPTVYQGVYNVIQRSIEAELLVACRRYGLDVVVYNPIAGGLLSGKYKAADLQGPTAMGRFSDKEDSRMGEMYRKRYFRDTTGEVLASIEAAAKQHDLTILETALRWMLFHSHLRLKDGNDGLVLGASSLQQLQTNLGIIKDAAPLPQDVLDVLDAAWLTTKARAANYWHGELEYGYDTQQALFGEK